MTESDPIPAEPLPPVQTVEFAARSCLALGAISTLFGAAMVIGPGYLNPLRFGPWFVGLGLIGWLAPGLAMLFGGWYLRARRRWAANLAAAGALWQFVAAAVLEIGQFYFEPISPILVIVGAVWLVALVALAVQLSRAAVALRADVRGRHGFEVRPIPVAERHDEA